MVEILMTFRKQNYIVVVFTVIQELHICRLTIIREKKIFNCHLIQVLYPSFFRGTALRRTAAEIVKYFVLESRWQSKVKHFSLSPNTCQLAGLFQQLSSVR